MGFIENKKYEYKIIYKDKIYPMNIIHEILEKKIKTSKFKLTFHNQIPIINDFFVKFPISAIPKFERIKIKKIWICIDLKNISFIHLMKYKN